VWLILTGHIREAIELFSHRIGDKIGRRCNGFFDFVDLLHKCPFMKHLRGVETEKHLRSFLAEAAA